MTLRLGPVTAQSDLVLAPLAAISTPAMRRLCEEAGCGLTFTEMVSAPGLLHGATKVAALVARSTPGFPFAVQLVAGDPETLEAAAARVAAAGADLVDLNMGCPAEKVAKTGGGSALLREPDRAVALVRAAVRGVAGAAAVTVKLRLGWAAGDRTAETLAPRLVEAGAVAVTVHGRTAAQGFTGTVDLEGIRRVVAATPAPVIGNGDVKDAASYLAMRERTGCAGVMVGRAARGNPWLFGALAAASAGQPPPAPPTQAERLAALRRHLALELETSAGPYAVLEARKHLAWLSHGLLGSAGFRQAIQRLATPEEVGAAIDRLEAAQGR